MTSDDPTEMVRERMWVERPAGTRLSQSRTSGGYSPLVRGDATHHLETHVTLYPDTADDEDDGEGEGERESSGTALKVLIGVAVGIAGTLAVVKAAPIVKRRLNDLRSKWRRNSAKDTPEGQTAPTDMSTWDGTAAGFSHEVDIALGTHSTSMTSAEAQKRLLALMAAAAFIADQVRTLSHARIEDDDAAPELRGALEKLTATQVTDSINRSLEADSSLLDEETSAEFMEIFGGGRFVEGRYVPLRNERVREALRLGG
ncbi:hypothetical protein H8N01_26315 [Streptomyces sp. AC536]|uniref:hypothetical protein n=1 Tax=Streptomyces buecherae TaxID=2763006 RepID=UPI00164D7812|nr:hypothetical protein [Streptomyces buecherae]MBC3985998.1 hypothetical protein [Streptomyces buecherae]QNJ39629.1 hypothetical protein H7H31_06810 [Streptomyces buecherae]